MSVDLRLMAVVDPAVLQGRDLVRAARAAETGGATVIQLRMKGVGAGAMLPIARRLHAELSVPLIINDRADVALSAPAHGVHLGADDPPPEAIRRLAPRPFLIGVSIGGPAEAAAVGAADVDYWSVGPVFATQTKADAGPAIGIDGFRDLARRASAALPVMGIGGIDAANVEDVIRAGAGGVAVISAIFQPSDVARAARSLRDAVDAALAARRDT